jgi:NAD(P)-dependent dehydrogenase (short-subunit alcohol dehydrogenase family)/rhamnose utilization protein RhaD (predicted bifunctional aldolase and dehydrogenase)
MEKELQELVRISRFYGSNKDYVIAGGGNTSFKNDKYLWVKASGTSLATIDINGFACLSREILSEIETKTYSEDPVIREREVKDDLYRALADKENPLRPSVETSLHNLLAYKFVVHLHPWLVNALLCGRNSRKLAPQLFGSEALYVAYTDPGHVLFEKMHVQIQEYRAGHAHDPKIILLENHGIFVSADTTAEIGTIYESVFSKLRSVADKFMEITDVPADDKISSLLPALRMLLSNEKLKTVCFRNNTLIHHFGTSMDEARKVASPFIPDQIVYCKAKYIYLDHSGSAESMIEFFRHQLDRFRTEFGYDPKVILIRDLGLVAIEDSYAQSQTVLDVYEDQMKISFYSEFFGGQRFLTPEEISFIDNWEVENYRRKVAAGQKGGRVEGKTAIITGGALGFGAGIAENLFHEKANIVIADINPAAGEELVNRLNAAGGKNKAIYLQADVTNEKSIQRLVHQTVSTFGGIDLLISNAGILQAGSLEELSVETFELVTRVNYEGYFICTKIVSAVMKLQSQFNEKQFADIIQINSKSGLRGSNRNFAYAGGKFGGIGLTQSFALELIPYRIKVNSICPGNFFEGPLWSDPKNGLFVQYLRTGKVPGAKTIEEVKKFYEDQVPAKRGCQVGDVMKAIYYLVEQEYETGQALPVTGGQVMLS